MTKLPVNQSIALSAAPSGAVADTSGEPQILWQGQRERIVKGLAGILVFEVQAKDAMGQDTWRGTLTTVGINIKALEDLAAQNAALLASCEKLADLAQSMVIWGDSNPDCLDDFIRPEMERAAREINAARAAIVQARKAAA